MRDFNTVLDWLLKPLSLGYSFCEEISREQSNPYYPIYSMTLLGNIFSTVAEIFSETDYNAQKSYFLQMLKGIFIEFIFIVPPITLVVLTIDALKLTLRTLSLPYFIWRDGIHETFSEWLSHFDVTFAGNVINFAVMLPMMVITAVFQFPVFGIRKLVDRLSHRPAEARDRPLSDNPYIPTQNPEAIVAETGLKVKTYHAPPSAPAPAAAPVITGVSSVEVAADAAQSKLKAAPKDPAELRELEEVSAPVVV